MFWSLDKTTETFPHFCHLRFLYFLCMFFFDVFWDDSVSWVCLKPRFSRGVSSFFYRGFLLQLTGALRRATPHGAAPCRRGRSGGRDDSVCPFFVFFLEGIEAVVFLKKMIYSLDFVWLILRHSHHHLFLKMKWWWGFENWEVLHMVFGKIWKGHILDCLLYTRFYLVNCGCQALWCTRSQPSDWRLPP